MTTKSDKTSKDTIYVDVDDEITAIIDKVVSSKHKIVALVLPRRATVLQSMVNMKLLKRSSESKDKHLVLVTTEPGLLPLAGAVGLYVAKTPTSKPEIPVVGGSAPTGDDETLEEGDFSPSEHANDKIGALAGPVAIDEPIEIDNEDKTLAGASAAGASRASKQKASKPKKGKDKKLKVPSFSSWRNRAILIGLGVAVLIAGFVLAFVVLPKATIAIQTDSETLTKNMDITLSPTATSVDADDMVVPARIETVEKTTTATAEATGQENQGDRAEGSVKFTVRQCGGGSTPSGIATGTGISVDGRTYITQGSASFNFAGWDGPSCIKYESGNVDIRAQSGGSNFNTSGQKNFTVAGRSDATARGSANGGTDEIVKVLSQADIDGVKQKLSSDTSQADAAKQELTQRLRSSSGDFIIEESFHGADPAVTESAKAGDRVDSVTITQKTTYSMASVSRSDLESLIKQAVAEDIDTERQAVLDSGLDEANFRLQNYADGKATMALSTRVVAGPKLDEDAIKEQAAGLKAGDVEELLQSYPGVTGVEVRYSPFWVSSVPKNTSKITIEYEQ